MVTDTTGKWGFGHKLLPCQIGSRPTTCYKTGDNNNNNDNDKVGSIFAELEGPGSISYGQYPDRALGKFSPLYDPHLYLGVWKYTNCLQTSWVHRIFP